MTSAPADVLRATPAVQEVAYPSTFYAWYCVFILLGIYINSFLDRQILALLVPTIRADLGLSDTQMGLLGGPAFAISYIVAGLPLGWLADRMSRRLLVGAGQIVWSVATAAFGMTNGYAQMVAARLWVGAGESTLGPSAYSMITDLFPPRRLALALSVYGMGIYVGGGLASLVGGYALGAMGVTTNGDAVTYVLPLVGERKAWQVVFFVIATFTIPLTILLLTMREPVRRGRSTSARASVSFPEFTSYVKSNLGTLLCHNIGFAWLSFSGYGASFWTPTVFARIFKWDIPYIGQALGWVTILAGPAGVLFGGWLADRMLERGYSDAKVRVGLVSSLVWLPFGIAYPLVADANLAFALVVPATFTAAMSWGVAPAAVQEMMPSQLRGQTSAIYLFVVNLLGLAFGPSILGFITDFFFRDPMKVHYSLVATGVGAHLISAVLLFLCLRRYRDSLAFLKAWQKKHQAA